LEIITSKNREIKIKLTLKKIVMKKILFILVIISFWGASFSQNTHFEYWLSNNPFSNSAVTIVNSNNIAYLIQTESNNIHVSDIDPTNMQPLGNTSSYNFGIFNTIYLNGGYEDFQGNLIAYGYAIQSFLIKYLIIKIDLNTMDVYYNYGTDEEIIEGCSGYDVNGNICNLFLLNNLNHEVIAYDENLMPCTTLSVKARFGIITDISWNPYKSNFIASGTYINNSPTSRTDPFLMYFTCDQGDPNYFIFGDQFIISNQQFFQRAEGRTLHEVIDGQHLILTQDLRDLNSDYIWITHFDDYSYSTLSISNSTIFEMPTPKLILQDMKYDSYNNKLTILGRDVYCFNGINFIAQIDPYSLTGLNMAQIMDQNSNTSCVVHPPTNYMYGNEMYLQRLELNPFNNCLTILSTGINKNAGGTSPYITETYDISNSQCDQFIYTSEQNPTINNFLQNEVYLIFPYQGIQNQNPSFNLYLNQNIVCNDVANCGKSPIKPDMDTQLIKKMPNISLYSCDYFECNHFSETVYYYLYDLAGKLIIQGITENGIKTLLPVLTNGIYIISAIDELGNKKTEKVIYFK